MKRKITIEIDEGSAVLLEVLAHSETVDEKRGIEGVVTWLAVSAADGIRRPGAWERSWVEQCFGSGWEELLETDPDCEWHERPRKAGK